MELDMNRQATLDSDLEFLQTGGSLQLPAYNDVASMPGFRFQPTEEELVGFYLRSMVMGNRLEVDLINVLNLYRYDPWELPAMAFMQSEREWLFFCPRDKKYPNGARPNRVTASGYWKATSTDRPVRRALDARCIGLKKTLVFYTGKAPRGRKTEWIMNEYRLPQNEQNSFCQTLQNCHHLKSTPRTTDIDRREVALCRIYKKPFQVNLISATANVYADNFMTDVDPSGCTTPQNPASDMNMDTGISTSSTNGCHNDNIVKQESELWSNSMLFKYPAIRAPSGDLSDLVNVGDKLCGLDHVFKRSVAEAEPSTHQVGDRLNWSDCLTSGESVSGNLLPRPGDLCPTIASIDRLLKTSMWLPFPPLNLDYAGAVKLGGDRHDIELDGFASAIPPNIDVTSSQFVWN